ncbi:MAG: hypothetical protein IPL79_20330 [Myxococcales bacterium]|nr:hypothetical protein [Myxococcales bacterium]
MNEAAIAQILGTELLKISSPAPRVVWDNQDASPARPYLQVQMVPVSRQSPGLAGGGVIARGFMQVTVVASAGGFATAALALAQDVADQFPKALRLAGTGGVVTITEAARIMPGYTDGTDWRIPVQADYFAG